jgi:hypothetical protein
MIKSIKFEKNGDGLFSEEILAELFCAEVNAIKRLYDSEKATENDKYWLPRELLGDSVIRLLTQKRGRFYVSKGVQKIVDKINKEHKDLKFDFRNVLIDYYQKKGRKALTPYKKEEPFRIEHMFPCMMASKILLKNKYDDYALKEFFKNYPVCWITESENKTLEKKGYRSERPESPFETYKKCGIVIADEIPEEMVRYWEQKTEEAKKCEV